MKYKIVWAILLLVFAVVGIWEGVRLRARTEGRKRIAAGLWSFQPVKPSAIPKLHGSDWVGNPIDAFVLAALEGQNVQPAAEASRETLIRRLSFDLSGLPPTLEEVHAFCADANPAAYDQLVDRLLSSPRFGEHWGRHWLDLARYADSDGYEKDPVRPYAYLFRDWVIQSVNDDLPFDEFTRQQLAGDLLPRATKQQKIAAGFHRQTLSNKEDGVDQEEFRCKAIVDRVNTTASVWLGLTVACAECHDHKYDPITQREYFQLYAFFDRAAEAELFLPTEDDLKEFRSRWQRWKDSGGNRSDEPRPPKAARAASFEEVTTPRATYVHVRGDFLRRGEGVSPSTLKALHAFKPRNRVANRLDLANWIVSPENPLTARVAVNHIWAHLFGNGLVRTADDFGSRGEKPSHPELLDWLALEFQRLGWSRKALIRLIVCSATYRQSSEYRPELAQSDPENRWLARQNRLRLPAESIWDRHLAVSGLLDSRIGGQSVRPPLPADIAALGYADSIKWKESEGADRYRRAMYIHWQRTVPYPLLITFDAPDGLNTCVRRERSSTPQQALARLNDPVLFECAKALAAKVECSAANESSRIERCFRLCLGRKPSDEEIDRLMQLWRDATIEPLVQVVRTLMNLDEFVTRE